jgi:hypothetical protein
MGDQLTAARFTRSANTVAFPAARLQQSRKSAASPVVWGFV